MGGGFLFGLHAMVCYLRFHHMLTRRMCFVLGGSAAPLLSLCQILCLLEFFGISRTFTGVAL